MIDGKQRGGGVNKQVEEIITRCDLVRHHSLKKKKKGRYKTR